MAVHVCRYRCWCLALTMYSRPSFSASVTAESPIWSRYDVLVFAVSSMQGTKLPNMCRCAVKKIKTRSVIGIGKLLDLMGETEAG